MTAPTGVRERQHGRIVAAFVLTPVSMALVAALCVVSLRIIGPGSQVLGETLSQALIVFLWSPLLAYPVAFLLGAPLYVLIGRFWRITVGTCVVGGAAAGLIGSIVVVAIEGGDLVTGAAVGIFAVMAAIGAVYGAVFWLLAFWHRAPKIGTQGSAARAQPEDR